MSRIGRQLLVGISDRDRTILERRQFYGMVTEVADGGVVVTNQDGGETLLPSDADRVRAGRPGAYRLASGVEVVDPDFLSTWEVTPGVP